jgi:hypothetical protein
MPPQDDLESDSRPGLPRSLVLVKPPLPTLASSRSSRENSIEVQLPPLISGTLIMAFSAAVADALGNELITYYYLPDERIKINLDMVVERIISDFVKNIWDELFEFYRASNAEHGNQVTRLFEGPIRQIILILYGPEVSRCILERIGPGLSRRPLTWTETARGVDPSLALQLICGYWHRNFASRSPGGNPDDIARSIGSRLLSGESFRTLVSKFKKTLYTPHLVQVHLMESTIWEVTLKRRQRPPTDGFHLFQFRFEFDASQRFFAASNPSDSGIKEIPVITGTAEECGWATVRDYTLGYWPRTGGVVLEYLERAMVEARLSHLEGRSYTAMSFWESSNPSEAALYPGLRLLHFEIEPGAIRVTVSAWVQPMIDVLQQLAWTCAALSSSPVPDGVVECRTRISSWEYDHDLVRVNLGLLHKTAPEAGTVSWLRQNGGAVISSGFPVGEQST